MEKGRKVLSVLMIFSFITYYVGAENVAGIAAKTMERTKNYIVCVANEKQVKEMEKAYISAGETSRNGKGQMQENEMTSLKMTEEEAQKLARESGVQFVEEDRVVEASTNRPWSGKEKKEKKIKENKSEDEWNIRMIRSDKVKKKKKNRKVKIAVLDSGVDYGNDIDVVQTISLVPGEEEMSPLFMDGTGHGNSVAGLIAAADNGEGITGINPNAEIYSIRVLDDQNCAPVSRVVAAIYQAIDWKVNIINMSFGVSAYSAALDKAIQAADKAGILVIAAAGNTGEAGVQYPAALDEVMAVGSVDQHGDVVESSAKGNEVEIVAPGELVRSTGVLGDQRVDSGTSLAAPQVAAVASLIWEKDFSVSPNFVRELLRKSANTYGPKEAYGSGLLDAEHALKNYDTFKKQYSKKGREAQIEENEKTVLNFEETNCVKGSWVPDIHEDMVPSTNYNVQKGARFPDTKKEEYTINKQMQYYIFARMTINPWWHGFLRYNTTPMNYVATYIYETRLANQQTKGGTAAIPGGLASTFALDIRNDISRINWSKEFEGETVTAGKKRAFIWGMAIHNMTDAYAHSTYAYLDNAWRYLNHAGDPYPYADDTSDKYGDRFACAKEAVNKSMEDYNNKRGGSYEVYLPALENAYNNMYGANSQRVFKMADIKRFVREVAGAEAGELFNMIDQTPNYNTK